MSFVRLLVRGGILAMFGVVAVVAMTILFSAQIRFDQAAELQIRGHTQSGVHGRNGSARLILGSW